MPHAVNAALRPHGRVLSLKKGEVFLLLECFGETEGLAKVRALLDVSPDDTRRIDGRARRVDKVVKNLPVKKKWAGGKGQFLVEDVDALYDVFDGGAAKPMVDFGNSTSSFPPSLPLNAGHNNGEITLSQYLPGSPSFAMPTMNHPTRRPRSMSSMGYAGSSPPIGSRVMVEPLTHTGVSRGKGLSFGGVGVVRCYNNAGHARISFPVEGGEEDVDPRRLSPIHDASKRSLQAMEHTLSEFKDREELVCGKLDAANGKNKQQQKAVRKLRQEVKEGKQDFASLFRGSITDRKLTRRGRQIATAVRDASVGGLEKTIQRRENEIKKMSRAAEKLADRVRGREIAVLEEVQNLRILKNSALARARRAEQERDHERRSLARLRCPPEDRRQEEHRRMPAGARALVERAELDAVLALERAEEAEAICDELTKKCKDAIEDSTAGCEIMLEGNGTSGYKLEVLEMGMEMMGRGLTAEQARGAMRSMMHGMFPAKTEGIHYRIMSTTLLKRLRRILKPLLNLLAMDRIRVAKRFHLIHDATTKKGISIFAVTVVVEHDDGSVEEFPFDSDMLTDGSAQTEFEMIERSLLAKNIGCVAFAHINIQKCASATSDNAAAAVATSRKLQELQGTDREDRNVKAAAAAFVAALRADDGSEGGAARAEHQIQAALLAHSDFGGGAVEGIGAGGIGAGGGAGVNDAAGAAADADLQRILVVLGCSEHQVNLLSEAGVKDETKTILWAQNFVYYIRMLQRLWRRRKGKLYSLFTVWPELVAPDPAVVVNVSDLVHSLPKLLSPYGRDADYHLSENKELANYVDSKGGTLLALPAVKGSRQNIKVEIAAAMVVNAPHYVDYLSQRIVAEPSNKLLGKVFDGLSDRWGMIALLARSLIFVTVIEPARFILNSLAKRPDVHHVFCSIRSALNIMDTFTAFGHLKGQVLYGGTGLVGTPQHNAWRGEYDEWEAATRSPRDEVLTLVMMPEYVERVRLILRVAAGQMLVTLERNVDSDFSDRPDLQNAPVSSSSVEAFFGSLDYVLTHISNISKGGALGVAAAQRSGAFIGREEQKQRDQRRRRKGGGGGKLVGGDEEEEKEGAELSAYKSMPREKRELLVRYLLSRKGFKEKVIDPEAAAIRAQVAESTKRKLNEGVVQDNRAVNRAMLYYNTRDGVALVRTKIELDQRLAAENSAGARNDMLRDQIRYRLYVLQRPRGGLPAIGNGAGQAEHDRLYLEVAKMIEKEETEGPLVIPEAPSALALRPDRSGEATSQRAELDRIRQNLVDEANKELDVLREQEHVGDNLPPLLGRNIAVSGATMERRQRRRRGGEADGVAPAAELAGLTFSCRSAGADNLEITVYKIISTFWSLVDDTPLVLFYDTSQHGAADEAAILHDPSAFEHAFVCTADHMRAWMLRVRQVEGEGAGGGQGRQG